MPQIGKPIADGGGVSLQGEESILGLGSGDVAQPCKCTTELHTLK